MMIQAADLAPVLGMGKLPSRRRGRESTQGPTFARGPHPRPRDGQEGPGALPRGSCRKGVT